MVSVFELKVAGDGGRKLQQQRVAHRVNQAAAFRFDFRAEKFVAQLAETRARTFLIFAELRPQQIFSGPVMPLRDAAIKELPFSPFWLSLELL